MNVYQTAIKALENCVKDAMENDVDSNLQSEIWRHYQGMKSIRKSVESRYKVSPTKEFLVSDNNYDIDYNITFNDSDSISVGAAQPVDTSFFGAGNGTDVITFS